MERRRGRSGHSTPLERHTISMTTSPHRDLIGGEWRTPSSVAADTNPSNTDELVGEVASAAAAEFNPTAKTACIGG